MVSDGCADPHLLAVRVSKARTIPDAVKLFNEAKARAARKPKQIITDGLAAYPEGIEAVFGGDTRHTIAEGITFKPNNNLIERLNGTFRERIKVMRGLDNPKTADLMLDGFMLHYNHMKPHMGIGNRYPAQAAGLPIVFENWENLANLRFETVERFRERRLKDRTFKPRVPKPRMPRQRTFSIRRTNRRRP